MSCQFKVAYSKQVSKNVLSKRGNESDFFPPNTYMSPLFNCSSNTKGKLDLASLRGTAVSKSLLVLLA